MWVFQNWIKINGKLVEHKKKDETNQEETKIVFLTKNAHCLQTW